MRIGFGILVAAVATMCFHTPAMAQRASKVGTLDCRLEPSIGLIIGSRQRMDCRFTPSYRGARSERYTGVATRFGLDIGITTTGRMIWAVLARTRGVAPGALAGTYVGASGEVTFGLGAGANVLVGGFNRSIVLQPLSVSGQAGLNLALGVAGLTLTPRR